MGRYCTIVYTVGNVEEGAPIRFESLMELNSTIKLNGNLDETEFTPDLKSDRRSVGLILSMTLSTRNSLLLAGTSSNIKFIDLAK
jgi:hypothetical protein